MNETIFCDVCLDPLINEIRLGEFPVADHLSRDAEAAKRSALIPVVFSLCERCLTVNQMVRLDNEDLFPADYHYRAGLTDDVLKGMEGLLSDLNSTYSLKGKTLIDVGTNDATLLDLAVGYGLDTTIGVEPTNAIDDNLSKKHVKFKEYFDIALAQKIRRQFEKIDFIVFTNVFAHIDPFGPLMSAVLELMSENTVLVIENHYLGSILDQNQFDTFYHEHPRTYSVSSFLEIAARFNLSLEKISFPARYGGNIRVFLKRSDSHEPSSLDIKKIVKGEQEKFPRKFRNLLQNMDDWAKKTSAMLAKFREESTPFFFRTFPARSSLLLGLLPEELITGVSICERSNSKKIGYFIPRTGNEIIDINHCVLLRDPTAVCVNLSWHISNEILKDMMDRGFKGTFIDIL